jgi:hypothetical protein
MHALFDFLGYWFYRLLFSVVVGLILLAFFGLGKLVSEWLGLHRVLSPFWFEIVWPVVGGLALGLVILVSMAVQIEIEVRRELRLKRTRGDPDVTAPEAAPAQPGEEKPEQAGGG